MKILQIYESYGKVGPEGGPVPTIVWYLSKHLVKRGHEVTVFEDKSSKNEPAIEYIDGIKFVRFDRKRTASEIYDAIRSPLGFMRVVWDEIRLAMKINKYHKKGNFDIVHVHFPIVAVILMILNFNRGLQKKIVYTFHRGFYGANLPDRKLLPWYFGFIPQIDLLFMRYVGKVVVLSDVSRLEFISIGKLKPEDIVFVPNGVDTEKFSPDVNTDNVKKKYGLNNKTTILFVGSITKRKGVEYLVKAANIIVNYYGYKHVLFLLVGKLSLEKEFVERIFKLVEDHKLEKNVKLAGFVPYEDLRKLHATCDIFILPSFEESFGLVLTESMASGKPLIGTNIRGISSQIKDGWNGFLAEPANEKQLAERIKYLVDNEEERERMGRNSRRFAEEEFDWSKIAEKYLEVYGAVVR